MVNLGKPIYWKPEIHLKAIEQMVCADEITIALEMFDKIPGYYRDHYPNEFKTLKDKIMQCTFDNYAYIECETPLDLNILSDTIALPQAYPRADVLAEQIRLLNEQGQSPWIYEMAFGSGWLPAGLQKRNYLFDYYGKSMNLDMIRYLEKNIKTWKEKPHKNQKTFFVCYELLEHLKDPTEIKQTLLRSKIDFDMIFLSTPRYTHNGGHESLTDQALGHLRTYTPKEFIKFAQDNFSNYELTFIDHETMVILGKKI